MAERLREIIRYTNGVGETAWQFATAMSVQVSVLIAILAVLDLVLLRRLRVSLRYAVWTLVLVKLVLPVSLASPVSLARWLPFERTTRAVADDSDLPAPTAAPARDGASRIAQSSESSTPAESSTSSPRLAPAATAVSGSVAPPPGHKGPVAEFRTSSTAHLPSKSLTRARPSFRWKSLLLLGWLGIVAGLIALLIRRIIHVRRLVSRSTAAPAELQHVLTECLPAAGRCSKRVRLRISPDLDSPAICGFWRATILIPDALIGAMAPARMRFVFAHELAHWKRFDLQVNCLQTVLQVIYFFHPLVWLANAVLQRLREQAVDDAVLVMLAAPAAEYSSVLLDIAAYPRRRAKLALGLTGVVESRTALGGRIARLLTRPLPKSAKLGIAGLMSVLLLGFVLLPMDTNDAQIAAEEAAPAETGVEGPDQSAAQLAEVLDQARRASAEFDEVVKSAEGTGTFRRLVRERGQDEPALRTEAEVEIYYDRGKYRMRMDYERKLKPTSFVDENGQRLTRIVDWKPEEFFVLFDGQTAMAIENSKSINPLGYRNTRHPSMNSAAAEAGMAWGGDLVRLGYQVADLKKLVQALGAAQLVVTPMPDGSFRLYFVVQNAPHLFVELDVRPDWGFNVAAKRIYKVNDEEPHFEMTAEWKSIDGVWYVHELTQEQFEGDKKVTISFRFDKFELNPKIDPWMFTLDSIESSAPRDAGDEADQPGSSEGDSNPSAGPHDEKLPQKSGGVQSRVQPADLDLGGSVLEHSGWEIQTILHPAHSQMVWSVAFAPDGKTIATAGADKTVKLWDVSSGELLLSITRPVNCTSVAFSPDGSLLAIAGGDHGHDPAGEFVLWDLDEGNVQAVLESHETAKYVKSAAFSPDGVWVASGGTDAEVKLWHVGTGRLHRKWQGHTALVSDAAFSADGQILASASFDTTVKLWNVVTGREIGTLAGHEKEVRDVTFSPTGDLLVSTSEDKTARVWNVASGELSGVMDGHSGRVFSSAFTPDGRFVATGGERMVILWDASTQSWSDPDTFPRASSTVVSLAFSPDGRRLAFVSGWNSVQIWTR